MGIVIQERLGSVYAQNGTAGSATYDLRLDRYGGWFGGPIVFQINGVAWAGTWYPRVSYNGTTFISPNLTSGILGTAGIITETGYTGAASLTGGTCCMVTVRSPVKTVRLGIATLSGSVDATWAALVV
jgi:hypothetical protein